MLIRSPAFGVGESLGFSVCYAGRDEDARIGPGGVQGTWYPGGLENRWAAKPVWVRIPPPPPRTLRLMGTSNSFLG